MGRSGFRSVVIGLDGSAHSRRAVAFLARLKAPARGRVTCVRVVEPMHAPAMPLVPSPIRAQIAGQAAALNLHKQRAARRDVDAAVERLKRSGWRARGEVRTGVPLTQLLAAVKSARADILVLGARGVAGVTRFLLGSVAETALKRSPVSVLIVP